MIGERKKLITEVYKNLHPVWLLYTKGNLAMEKVCQRFESIGIWPRCRMISTFGRFDCKVILTEALR